MDLAPLDRMAQGAHDRLLADHVGERAGAMLAIERSRGHRWPVYPRSRPAQVACAAWRALPQKPTPRTPASHALREYTTRWGPATLAILGGALALWLIAGVGFLNYDTLYALVWGQQITRGETPEYGLPIAPTPHPLIEVLGIPLAPLGAERREHDRGGFGIPGPVGLWLGALPARRGLVRASRRHRGGARVLDQSAGPLLWGAGLCGHPLHPARAVGSLVETRHRLAGAPVLVLLGLAGLLRPEAWLLCLGWYWS